MITFSEVSMKANVTIRVNGRSWQRVKSFAKSGPDDRHYVLEMNRNNATVIFGDSEHGAIPPIGSNIQATYRHGSGNAGDVKLSYRASVRRIVDEVLWVAIRNRTNTISFEKHSRFKRK
jgi:hypothetical protein